GAAWLLVDSGLSAGFLPSFSCVADPDGRARCGGVITVCPHRLHPYCVPHDRAAAGSGKILSSATGSPQPPERGGADVGCNYCFLQSVLSDSALRGDRVCGIRTLLALQR